MKTYIFVTKMMPGIDGQLSQMPCGMMAAQVSHATAKAVDHGYDIKSDEPAIILEVENSFELAVVVAELLYQNIDFIPYYERNKLFGDEQIFTALVLRPIPELPNWITFHGGFLDKYKLWTCNCNQ